MEIRLLRSLRTSLSARLTSQMLLLTLVVFLTISYIVNRVSVNAVMSEIDRHTTFAVSHANEITEAHLSSIETILLNNRSDAEENSSHPDSCYFVLRQILEINPSIEAVTMMFSPNYFPSKGRYYAPSVSRLDENTILSSDLSADGLFDYLECDSSWINTSLRDAGYWSEPYFDSYDTQMMQVSYSIPLHDASGAIYAILCADIRLDWLVDLLQSTVPTPHSRNAMVTLSGHFVAHSDSTIIYSRSAGDLFGISITELIERDHDEVLRSMLPQVMSNSSGKEILEHEVFHYSTLGNENWRMYSRIPLDDILSHPRTIRNYLMSAFALFMLFFAIICHRLISCSIKPLSDITEASKKVAAGHFDIVLPRVKGHDEVRLLRENFTEMQHSLVQYIAELQETTASKATIETELQTAAKIQMSMIPQDFQPIKALHNCDLYASLSPAKAVGGDLYDFFINDQRLYFIIGDVSGKGVPAALFMAVAHTLFRVIGQVELLPSRIVSIINNHMVQGNDENMFVTSIIGYFDLNTGKIVYSNAGHNPALLLRSKADGCIADYVEMNRSMPIGIFPDVPYTDEELQLEPGESFILYTDGVTEAENPQKELYGEDRFRTFVTANPASEAQTLIENIVEDVARFADGAEQSDDITVMAIRYIGKSSSDN